MPAALDPDVRLHVVTGKGGTGKTTVAAALALAVARPGRRVLLAEVEGRQGLAQVFGQDPLPYLPTLLARSGDGQVHGLAVDAKAALLEYLEVFYRLGRAGRALERLGAVDFVTTIAPGLRDVLLTGKVYDALRQRADGRRGEGAPAWDAVVLDAPPTGRIGRFLNVNDDLAGLARMGPVHSQAQSIMKVLTSAVTAVHVVTLLEDMPVQETCDAVTELRGLGMPLGTVVVNQVRPPLLAPGNLRAALAGELDPATIGPHLATALRIAGLIVPEEPGRLAGALVAQAAEHAARVQAEDGHRKRLAEMGLPMVDLPQLPGVAEGMDLAALHELADVLGGRP
ncbi:MAG: ArsA-related P-loop ATPase [Kineosporiaceae bacterium]